MPAGAKQDSEEHLIKELSPPPTLEVIVDLVMRVKAAISFSEIIIGFKGDPSTEFTEVESGKRLWPTVVARGRAWTKPERQARFRILMQRR
jgi:hypothetical protein